MQNFSTNFQFNIAQMNSLAKEQEKQKNIGKRKQEDIARKINEAENQHHNTISATEHQDDSSKIKDEINEEENRKEKQKMVARPPEEDKKNILVYKDIDKGNLIDFSG